MDMKKKNSDKLMEASLKDKGGRVLVNGHKPDQNSKLKHGFRLIFGHASCFRLEIPLLAGEDAHHHFGKGLEDALMEVSHDDSAEMQDCRQMLDSISEQIGDDKCKEFLQKYLAAKPLVDEGNMITNELR